MLKTVSCFFAVLLIAGATVVAGDADLEGVKCVVANKAASEGASADYKKGKVYFCCGGCASKFAADSKKFEVKANHQLVATKQFEQTSCPFSGGDIDPEVHTTVAGTKIGFCCNGCKSKVESAKDDTAKMKLIFANKNFAKAFKKKSNDEG
jgi:hypothetical protein